MVTVLTEHSVPKQRQNITEDNRIFMLCEKDLGQHEGNQEENKKGRMSYSLEKLQRSVM